MDKHIQQAIAVLKETAPVNFERTMIIRKALFEKYSLSRSSSQGALARSMDFSKRGSILHPHALRRQASPQTLTMQTELNNSGLLLSTQKSATLKQTSTPEGHDEIADELDDYMPEQNHQSPERT